MFLTQTPSSVCPWPLEQAMALISGIKVRRHDHVQASVVAFSDMASLSDEDCMAVYQQGDPAAFRVIYYRYRDKVHRYTLRLAPRSSDAEEVFQDIWMAVIRGSHTYNSKLSFAAWLFSIAHRRAADRWRNLSRHAPDWQSYTDADGPDSLELPALTAHQTPERHVQNDALRKALLDAVDALPPLQREAFLLKAEGDLSLEDIAIAIATGVPRETVKSRLRYAQQRLRDALDSWQ